MVKHSEAGFTLVEFLIAAAIMTAVLGGTFSIATQMQRAYSTQLDDASAQQEGRFALDWIARAFRSAGSNAYSIVTSPCPAANTTFQAIRLDPNGNGIQDDVRIQADINPSNGLLTGTGGGCNTNPEAGEDITITHDPVGLVITKKDNRVGGLTEAMTDPIITSLRFTYLDSARVATAVAASIAYVQISVTVRSRAPNPNTNVYPTTTLQTEVRLRAR